jgi:uncharacterized membrane protein
MPLAVLRPDDWDFPLLLHVFGAMVLVGALAVVVTALIAAWRPREGSLVFRRLAFRTLLFAALPSFVLMRIGGQWLVSEENLDDVDPEPDWLGVGYLVADLGLLVLVATIVVAGFAARRGERGDALGRVTAVLATVLLAAYLVAVWAMTTKPD